MDSSEMRSFFMTERGIVAYDPRFDKRDYVALKDRFPEEEARRRKEALDSYVKRQFETHLGERFNVLLSSTKYDLLEGKIFGQDMETPFIDVIEKGVNYRKGNGREIDFKREEAELIGFKTIEEVLGRDETEVGTMMLSISPKGEKNSEYQHNFYDIFSLKEENGQRFIEARRYSSSLSIEEYQEAVFPLKEFEVIPTPEDFLSEPILIEPSNLDADNIHEILHREHDYMTTQEFEEIIKICTPLILSYIKTLSELPFNEERQILTFNAILNRADLAKEYISLKYKIVDIVFRSTEDDIKHLGRMPVRMVATACGASGGFSVGPGGPFSVSEYGGGFYATSKEWFNCPKCKYKASGPVGNICPGCGLTKERFVMEGGKKC